MVEKIKYYSIGDMSTGMHVDAIVKYIPCHDFDVEHDINDIMELYNINKFLGNKWIADYVEQEANCDVEVIMKEAKGVIGRFFAGVAPKSILDLYQDLDFEYKEDFLSLIEEWKLHKKIEEESFQSFINTSDMHYSMIMQFKGIVDRFGQVLYKHMMDDPMFAETLLRKFVYDGEGRSLHLPNQFSGSDFLLAMNNYIDSAHPHINQLEFIRNLPNGIKYKIDDRTRLKAKKRYEIERQKVFDEGTSFGHGVQIGYVDDLEDIVEYRNEGDTTICNISRAWIAENLDYPTLWNNFVYLFKYFDNESRFTYVCRKNSFGVFERTMRSDSTYIFHKSAAFEHLNMLSTAQLFSYYYALEYYGVRLEEMIEWFFTDYIKEEFGIIGFNISMPSAAMSDFEKCKAILPEIDRVLKQYNLYVEDGEIDEELLQISSSHMAIKDVNSLMKIRNVYPGDNEYGIVSYLLFSDQSSIFYIDKFKSKYRSFFRLVLSEKVKKDDFHDYQLRKMEILFDKKVIKEDSEGYIRFDDIFKVTLYYDLYENDVVNYWVYDVELRKRIDEWQQEGIVRYDDTLFSEVEQEYFDYHMNKARFSNSLDLRNRYAHGTHTNHDEEHRRDYFIFLKIMVFIVIKINSDLEMYEIKNSD